MSQAPLAGAPGTHPHSLSSHAPPSPLSTLPSKDRHCFGPRALDSWNKLCLATLLDTNVSNPMEYDFNFQLEIRGPCLLAGEQGLPRAGGSLGQQGFRPKTPRDGQRVWGEELGNPSLDSFKGHPWYPQGHRCQGTGTFGHLQEVTATSLLPTPYSETLGCVRFG